MRGRSSARHRRLRESRVRIAPTMPVPSLLRDLGVEPSSVLAEFGLTTAHFEHPDNTLSFGTRSALLGRCALAARCPHFGLLVGLQGSTSVFGAIGFLMQSATDVRTALALGTRYFRLHNPGVSVECREANGGFCVLDYTMLDEGGPGDEHTIDMAIAGMFRILQSLCGYHWRPVEVRFAHSRPRNVTPFRRFFQAPLAFDAEESALVFRSHWLDQLLSSADPLLHLFMQEHIDEAEAKRGGDLPQQLRRLLPSLVAQGRATPAEAARRLGLGVRTLNRRLATAGTTFVALLDEARHSMATQLLGSTSLLPGRVATRLGYANTSAFTRAFRRWSGTTPSEWRRRTLRPP